MAHEPGGGRPEDRLDPESITVAIDGAGPPLDRNPFGEDPAPMLLGNGAQLEEAEPQKFSEMYAHRRVQPPVEEPAHEESFQDPEQSMWIKNYEKEERKFLDYFPPFKWVPVYVRVVSGRATKEDEESYGALPYSLTGDLIAGLTVGFMLVPQSLAFALLAGLPVQIGLYASFAPLIVYALMGTIRQVQPGPTALMSLIAGSALDSMELFDQNQRVAGAALLAVIVGGISVILGAVQFGFIVDFMSHSVMTAFCSAAGITIATSQMKYMFGIQMERTHYWWETVVHLVTHLGETDGATFALAWVLLAILLFLKYWKSAGNSEARQLHVLWRYFPTDKSSCAFKTLKSVADMSSLLSVVLGWSWGAIYRATGVDSVRFVGPVSSEGFKFIIPGNGLSDFSFDSYFISAAIAAVVGFLETMAVGGKFAMQARYTYDANQELLALGFMNVIGGLMSGYPTTGSFSRTAVNAQFGATSLIACAISSLLVLISALFLLPLVERLPLCSLAPIIIQGAIGVVDVHEFQVAYHASFAEFIVMLATFVVSLGLTVKEGLAVGFLLSIMKTMYDLSNPNLAVCGRLPNGLFRDIRHHPEAELLPNTVVVRMDARLSFANSRKLREFCTKCLQVRAESGAKISYLIIDGRAINDVDLTGCQTIELLAESTHTRGVKLVVANLKARVAQSLVKAGVHQLVKKHEGFIGDFTLDRAVEITQGKLDNRMSKDLRDLISRHDAAQEQLANSQKSLTATIFRCGQTAAETVTETVSSALQKGKDATPRPQQQQRMTPIQSERTAEAAAEASAASEHFAQQQQPQTTPEPLPAASREPADIAAEVQEEQVEQPKPVTSLPPPRPPQATLCGNLTSSMFIPCGNQRMV